MAEFLENIERQPKFVVFKKLPILRQKCRMLPVVEFGQSMACSLQHGFGDLPTLDQLGV
jgi:hypothetical protein